MTRQQAVGRATGTKFAAECPILGNLKTGSLATWCDRTPPLSTVNCI
ncbi:hypothetical protein [Chamaesiphon sp. VAR_69_metabat_338]|nr:hypothetical protein [Chamaesiphon sp. VAR_69_metabat_338]